MHAPYGVGRASSVRRAPNAGRRMRDAECGTPTDEDVNSATDIPAAATEQAQRIGAASVHAY